MFKITVFVPIDAALAVMFCNEDEPCTTKSPATYNDPVTCVAEPDSMMLFPLT